MLHLPIGLAIANGDIVVNNAKPFAKVYKATIKWAPLSIQMYHGLPQQEKTSLYKNSAAYKLWS